MAAWSCNSGDVCFYSDQDGEGERCYWPSYDPDWLAGTRTCGWAETVSPRSVRNNGTDTSFSGVRCYSRINYNPDYNEGCTRRGTRGNFVTPVKLRSHQVGHRILRLSIR